MKKTCLKLGLIAILLGVTFISYSQIISTVAGNGVAGFSGDGGQATAAEFSVPFGMAIDASGNYYIADACNNVVQKVNTSGIINIFAGTGNGPCNAGGYSGDGGQATAADLDYPVGVTLDASGNIYIVEQGYIRMVNTSNIISTVAGIGYNGYSGDGGPATAAELNNPLSLAADNSGNIYIADYENQRIRKINSAGIITTIAGNGYGSGGGGLGGCSGDGGPATAAEFYLPGSVTLDHAGNIFITEFGNERVREINTSGIINTIVGNGYISNYLMGGFSGDGGPATSAELSGPFNVKLDDTGNIYIADQISTRIRKVNTSGIINTIAGGGSGGLGDGGPATAAVLGKATCVYLDSQSNVYIVDEFDQRVRKITYVVTGINEISSVISKPTIFPSPTTGFFTISGLTQAQIIEIYNYLGQKVYTSTQPPPNGGGASFACQINISLLPNGIYLIRIVNKDGNIAAEKKIVKTE